MNKNLIDILASILITFSSFYIFTLIFLGKSGTFAKSYDFNIMGFISVIPSTGGLLWLAYRYGDTVAARMPFVDKTWFRFAVLASIFILFFVLIPAIKSFIRSFGI